MNRDENQRCGSHSEASLIFEVSYWKVQFDVLDFLQPSNTTLKRLTLDRDGGLRIWQYEVGHFSECTSLHFLSHSVLSSSLYPGQGSARKASLLPVYLPRFLCWGSETLMESSFLILNFPQLGQSSSDWTPVANWVVHERGSQCFAMATCGPYGLCKMTPPDSVDRVECTCPQGFVPRDETDFSRGCNRIQPLSTGDFCGDSKLFNMTKLDGIDMPWGGDYDNYTVEANWDNCSTTCLNSCNCTGVVYSEAEQRCWKKTGILYNLGYPTVVLHGNDRTTGTKVSSIPAPVHAHSDRELWILAPVLGGVFSIAVLIGCAYWYGCSLPQVCGGRGTGQTSNPSIPPYPGPPSKLYLSDAGEGEAQSWERWGTGHTRIEHHQVALMVRNMMVWRVGHSLLLLPIKVSNFGSGTLYVLQTIVPNLQSMTHAFLGLSKILGGKMHMQYGDSMHLHTLPCQRSDSVCNWSMIFWVTCNNEAYRLGILRTCVLMLLSDSTLVDFGHGSAIVTDLVACELLSFLFIQCCDPLKLVEERLRYMLKKACWRKIEKRRWNLEAREVQTRGLQHIPWHLNSGSVNREHKDFRLPILQHTDGFLALFVFWMSTSFFVSLLYALLKMLSMKFT